MGLLFFGRIKEQTRKVSLFRQVLAGIPGTSENRTHKAKVAFLAKIQAFDDAIDRAKAKHQPTAALYRAKTEFVHDLLRRAA